MVIYISWNPFGQYTSPYHCKKWVGSHGCYVSGAEWETWLSSVKAGIAQLPDRLPCFDFVLRIWVVTLHAATRSESRCPQKRIISGQEQRSAVVNPRRSMFTTPDAWLYSHWRNGKRTLSWALSQGGVGISDMCCAGLLIPSCYLSLHLPSWVSTKTFSLCNLFLTNNITMWLIS